MDNLHISCCDSACKHNSDSGYYGTCRNPAYEGTDMYGIDRVMVETCKLREKSDKRHDAARVCKTSNGYCIEFYPPHPGSGKEGAGGREKHKMIELPTSFDIYIEANGQRVAVVQSYQEIQREDGQYTIHLDWVHPVCGALKCGIHELDDFSLIVCKPDRKIVYSGCRWSGIQETGTLGDMAIERVAATAKMR